MKLNLATPRSVNARAYWAAYPDYPTPIGDAAKDYLIVVAKEKGYPPSWVPYRWGALDVARAEYKQAFGEAPKEWWTTGMIGSMLRQRERESQ